MSFSPFVMREDAFKANILDYTIPYNIESFQILTPVKEEMKENIFSYFTVFDINIWSLILISFLTMILIVSIIWKMVLIEKQLSFQLYSEICIRFYASFLNKGINNVIKIIK